MTEKKEGVQSKMKKTKNKRGKSNAGMMILLLGALAGSVAACLVALAKRKKTKKNKACTKSAPCSLANENHPMEGIRPQNSNSMTAESKCNSPEWERGPIEPNS